MSKEIKGVFWSAADHFSVQGVSFIISIIVARLVEPEAYGVLVMAQVFMSFAQIFIDSGFKEALIQKKDRTEIDYNTVFHFNLAISILLYIILFFAAPYIAQFYNEPILTTLTRVVSLSLVFSSLSLTQLVRLQVNLDFKTLAKARLFATIISGVVGIICAYKGLQVWALVIQSVLAFALTSLFLMLISKWIPKAQFSIVSFKQLFSFGSKLLFTYFITAAYLQFTNLFIGKVYSAKDLAYYNRGFNTSYIIPGSFISVIGRIAYPLFCENQNNFDSLRFNYRKYMRMEVILIFPLMILMAVLSSQIIDILLTHKWAEAAIYLSIFCMVYITQPILDTSRKLILAVGRADVTAKVTFYTRFMTFGILFATIYINPLAVALGSILNNLVESLIAFICVKKTAGFSIRGQIKDISDILLASIIAGITAYILALFSSNVYVSFILGFAGGLLSYIILMFVMRMEERHILLKIIKK